mmetsp:Transcript_22144/g.33170  ORF Transcript_22144/g.33170 Transcript_22144/m.33170 type:complete len:115 (+) Transcript_22144:47-391(+)|eukprot:CAMPEP_0206482000 /NCGR_PEP_ID=MMETSP0324_2-20121206/38560_1 /ASSEMBLY_ACC=CAM_ASM_000836 /TAXON_ID=2866 /ORGANISM="Crypthecodinium cohnii, Strain Seligo" /LENGTH=114 /DNA_ID=CAMNT_0053959757 /DNA_START=48 /DNA_END=392 /DNA_ORIENTATION=+
MGPRPSWKTGFKAHRIAAHQGNFDDNFVYHKEADSFPLPMARAARPSPPGAVKRAWTSVKKRLFPAGATTAPMMGFIIPLLGVGVMFTFVYSNAEDHMGQYMAAGRAAEQDRSV